MLRYDKVFFIGKTGIMEVFKAYQISTDYKDRQGKPSWERLFHAEVLFIDKSQNNKAASVFQLKDSFLPIEKTLDICRLHPSQFSKEGFVLLGEELSIDRKKKQILLNNHNTVSYNHLVIIGGSKALISFENEDLLQALQALYDALKVKPKIPSSFANPCKVPPPSNKDLHQEAHLSAQTTPQNAPCIYAIDKVVQPNFPSQLPQGIYVELNTTNKRLYEVQL